MTSRPTSTRLLAIATATVPALAAAALCIALTLSSHAHRFRRPLPQTAPQHAGARSGLRSFVAARPRRVAPAQRQRGICPVSSRGCPTAGCPLAIARSFGGRAGLGAQCAKRRTLRPCVIDIAEVATASSVARRPPSPTPRAMRRFKNAQRPRLRHQVEARVQAQRPKSVVTACPRQLTWGCPRQLTCRSSAARAAEQR